VPEPDLIAFFFPAFASGLMLARRSKNIFNTYNLRASGMAVSIFVIRPDRKTACMYQGGLQTEIADCG
jgi:hypothetical protein